MGSAVRKAFAQFLAGHFRAPELNLDRSGLMDPAAKVGGLEGVEELEEGRLADWEMY